MDSESERIIIRQAIQNRVPIPDSIKNVPELSPGLEIFLSAFFDLDTERNHSFGLTRIPWSCIKNYAEYYDFDEEETEDLFYFIREMDNANLKRLDEKQKQKTKSK